MGLSVKVTKKEKGVFVIAPEGSIDTETYLDLEKKYKEVIQSSATGIIFDMEKVTYISSMGLSTIFKARKEIEAVKGTLVITNLQPQIKRVFDVIKAIPDWIFESMKEADDYLDSFLERVEKKE
jgi:anti-sigma B factor antagonist